jgi:hypothetical protein
MVEGIYTDRETGIVVLIGRETISGETVPLTLEDIAVSFRLAARQRQDSYGVSFEPSLDNENTFVVRFFGGIENTHLGFSLFRADVALKEYSLGRRLGGETLQTKVSLHAPVLDRVASHPRRAVRFWLTSAPIVQTTDSGKLALIKNLGILLNAGRRASSVETDPSVTYFTRQFTAHWNELREESPDLAAFARIAQLFAVSRWLVKTKMKKLNWLDRHILRDHSSVTPKRIPKVTISYETIQETLNEATVTSIIQISGGILFGSPEARPEWLIRQELRTTEELLSAEFFGEPSGSVRHIKVEGRDFVGLVLRGADRP